MEFTMAMQSAVKGCDATAKPNLCRTVLNNSAYTYSNIALFANNDR